MYDITKGDLEYIVSCPSCESSDWTHIAEVESGSIIFLRTSECNVCSLSYRTIRPSLNWFMNAWSQRDKHQKSFKIDFLNASIEKDRYDRYCFIYKQLYALNAGKNLIDIGAGTGGGTVKFQENGYQCTVLEPDASRRQIAEELHSLKTDGRSVYDNIESLGKFDTGLLIHSLEHFHDPKLALQQIFNLLTEDGLLYIEVPDYTEYVKDWQDALYLAHISNFSQDNLVKICRAVGFSAITRVESQIKADGLQHLAIIFRKSKNSKSIIPNRSLDKPMKTVYSPDGSEGDYPIRFQVPCVNDISLCYKPNSHVHDSVRKNYDTRTLEKLSDNTYRVV